VKQTILTGIKPTGSVHIGNYFGAIIPAIELSQTQDANFFYFIADYHALTTVKDAKTLSNQTYEVAAAWLACGLNPEKVVFYKQSDIPEIFELTTILTNLTPKGLMNRAHAYKALVQENKANNLDEDHNINMGLYNYPILMTADIVAFNATKVPVGKDQKQHVEIARDIAKAFNNRYGKCLVETQPQIKQEVALITGTDGRKMSKSYNNIIGLFENEDQLLKKINRLVTDSKGIDEPKGTDNAVFELYALFANKQQTEAFKQQLESGISWGQAKKELFNLANSVLAPLREKYNYYMQNKHLIDEILQKGQQKAREVASETLIRVKKAIGVAK
jgi:tryptophanyl-tRNA synthetase